MITPLGAHDTCQITLGLCREQRAMQRHGARDHLSQHGLGLGVLAQGCQDPGEHPRVLRLTHHVSHFPVRGQGSLHFEAGHLAVTHEQPNLRPPTLNLRRQRHVSYRRRFLERSLFGFQRLGQVPLIAVRDREVVERLGRPEEYAKTALFLLEHDYINAEHIRMDGAIRMAPK